MFAVSLLVESITHHRADTTFLFGSEVPREQWAVMAGILSIAFSPALWSLGRGAPSGAAGPAMGSYDRVGEQPPPAAPPPRPGGVGFEPMNSEQPAPAPPASSYGQPPGPGFGAQPPSAGAPPPAPPASPPPQGESPWGGNR